MRLLLFILLCFQLGCVSDLNRLIYQENKAVVKYSFFLKGGTAFYISPTELLSAKHVCVNNRGWLSDNNKIEQVKYSKNYDLCYIKVKKRSKYFLKLAKSFFTDYSVCAAGFQQVMFYRVNCGKVIDSIHVNDNISNSTLYGGSFYLIPGMSGGPVMQYGKIVGVNVSYDSHSLHGFFEPLSNIKAFLRTARRENK